MQRTPQPEWMSVPQAAEALGCSDVWVIRMIQRGELEGFRLSGRAWAVRRAAVEKNAREYATRKSQGVGRPRSKLA